MSSDSENSSPDGKGYESERSETENRPNNDNEKKDSVIDNSENQTEFSEHETIDGVEWRTWEKLRQYLTKCMTHCQRLTSGFELR